MTTPRLAEGMTIAIFGVICLCGSLAFRRIEIKDSSATTKYWVRGAIAGPIFIIVGLLVIFWT